jgi:hypothetical protein
VFSNLMDHTESIVKRLTNDDKIDLGTFSLMEPGWWALHAAAIGGIYYLGSRLGNRY